MAWMSANGDPGDLCVLHRCDNPLCCNPAHLFLGTKADNSADMAAKGRAKPSYLRGEDHGNAKLNDVAVIVIRRCALAGIPIRRLAAVYRISVSHASSLASGRRCWQHVGSTP